MFMKKTGFLLKSFCLLGLIASLTLFTAFSVNANPDGRVLKHSAHEDSVTKFDRFEVTVPAEAANQEMTVEEVELDLKGINKPYNFKPVSKMFRFGPHGMKFSKGKELRFNLQLDAGQQGAELYYIDREKGRLERVEGQSYKPKTKRLEARLRHFSDFVAGIIAGWDGNGINPFSDYVHNGEETVSIATLSLQVRSTILSLRNRNGTDFHLTRSYMSNNRYYQQWGVTLFALSEQWYWDIPFLTGGYSGEPDRYSIYINIPGKGGFTIQPPYGAGNYPSDWFEYTINGETFRLKVGEYSDSIYMRPIVMLKDGTIIEYHNSTPNDYETITDPKGNCTKYVFSQVAEYSEQDETIRVNRISLIEDSVGRKIYFRYNTLGKLTKVEQLLSNGSFKTIMTCGLAWNEQQFTDSLGRTTTYKCISPSGLFIKDIFYPNGAHSAYSYKMNYDYSEQGDYLISSQKWYKPGNSSPFKTVDYDTVGLYYIKVNDGIRRHDYNFDWYGNTLMVNTFSVASETLIKQLSNSYEYLSVSKYKDTARLKTSAARLAKSDGTLGPASTYEYAYDNWGNITKVKDPYGTETYMAYANTDSNKNLSTINSLYQNCLYATGAGWNQILTKASLVKDPVHNTTQLKQTHYKYDTSGNLLQEDEVFGGGYLKTKYTYDSYGNMLTKTDANGNQLCFEYADTTEKPYKSAFLTRVYKPDGTTVAGYWYNFDTGDKIKATDPNGNVYRYEYDAVGRLTGEYLDNSDSNVAIDRILNYDDANNVVVMKFGNETASYQAGRLEYDPLFGKPAKLQRYKGLVSRDVALSASDPDWATQKVLEYDSNGRLANETTWEREDMPPHVTFYQYDELDRKILVTQPDGSTTGFEYDDRKITTRDAKGNKKEQSYDLLDRLIQVNEYPDPGSTYNCYTTQYLYDSFYDDSGDKPVFHIVKVINPRNAETINTYDSLGRLIRTDYPQNLIAAESFSYDNAGNLKTKTNGKGVKIFDYEYFAGYRLKTVTEPDGRTLTYTYDNNDNPLTQTTNGATYTYTYDARNRVKNSNVQLDNHPFYFTYDYDAFGRMISITYPGRTAPVTYTYDELDRLRNIPGFVNSCSYDDENKLTEMELGNGMKNTLFYDVNDRPTKIESMLLRDKVSYTDTITTEAETMNLVNAKIDDNASASGGKLVTISNPTGIIEGLDAVLRNKYSNLVLSASDPDSSQVYQFYYLSSSDRKWRFQNVGNGYYYLRNNYSNQFLTASDADGSQVGQQMYRGSWDQQWKLENTGNGYYYLRNKYSNQVLSVSDPEGTWVGQTIYQGSNCQQWQIQQQIESTGSATYKYTGEYCKYNLTLTYYGKAPVKILINNSLVDAWTVNQTSGLTTRVLDNIILNPEDEIKIESFIQGEEFVCIDKLELTAAVPKTTIAEKGKLISLNYSYDPAGNILKINGDHYAYDGLNRLTWAGNVRYNDRTAKLFARGAAWSYDGAGNMTGRQTYLNGQLQENITLGYDLANRLFNNGSTTYGNSNVGERLTKVQGTDSWGYLFDGESRLTKVTKNSSTVAESSYDGAGMRYKKVSNGKTTYYLYSGSNVIAEYTPADEKYTYYIFAGKRSIAEEKDGKKIFYHRDHLGSTRALTDQNKKLVGLSKYDAWGKLVATNEYDEGVINGDMELTNADKVNGWQAINQPVLGDCSYITTGGQNGSAAIKIVRTVNNPTAAWSLSNIYASPNTDYVITGSFLSGSTSSTQAKAQLLYYEINGVLITTHTTSALGYSGTGWKQFTLNSHAPSNAAVMEIRLTADNNTGMSYSFGGIRLKIPGLQNQDKFDYTGKKEDEGTELKYFGARFYDPEVGRFITPDTYTNLPNDERNFFITNENGFMARSDDPAKYNQYSYCQNNPINRIDPDGHVAFAIVFAPEIIHATIMGVGAVVATYEAIKSMMNTASRGAKSSVKSASTGKGKAVTKQASTSIPKTGAPNSVARKTGKDGQVIQERYYGPNGQPVRDVDYTDHGQPTKHTNPHEHKWTDGVRGEQQPVSDTNSESKDSGSKSDEDEN
jgi:RHS repeat-associated protein